MLHMAIYGVLAQRLQESDQTNHGIKNVMFPPIELYGRKGDT